MFSSIALIAILYVFLAYATVVGFDNNPDKLTAANVPMVAAAQGVASFLAFLAYIAGFASIVSSLFVYSRDPGLGERVGSIVADAE